MKSEKMKLNYIYANIYANTNLKKGERAIVISEKISEHRMLPGSKKTKHLITK